MSVASAGAHLGHALIGIMVITVAASAVYLFGDQAAGISGQAEPGGFGVVPPAQLEAQARERDLVLFRLFAQAQPDAFFMVGPGERLVCSNEAAQRLLMVPAHDAPLSGHVRDPDLLGAIRQVLAGAQLAVVRIDRTHPLDETFEARVCQMDLDERRFAVVVLQDLTAVMRIERARTDFLANASHELRTPLASLSGYIETLQGPARDDKVARERFLAIMSRQAERMRRLIDDLMSLSRIETNEHVPPAGNADVVALVREAIDGHAIQAGERAVQMEVIGPAHAMVTGDRFELGQIVHNLLDNAIKYARAGGQVRLIIDGPVPREVALDRAGRLWPEAARLAIISPPGAPGGRFFTLRVEDDGPGIARRHLPRLSERFFRVEREEHSGPEAPAGTGLGLAIVKHVVNRHRGGLQVESQPGRGTAFSVSLPVAASAQDALPKAAE